MTISVNTNIVAMQAYRGLSATTTALGKSMQKLATGVRINSAADDAGGLALVTRMNAQIRGWNQAVMNVNDGISLLDVADAALEETANAIQSIRDMAVEAANASLSATDRTALDDQVTELEGLINDLADDTKYNGTVLLDGTFTSQDFQIGPNNGDTLTISLSTDADMTGLGFTTSDVSSVANASSTIDSADDALDALNGIRATIAGYTSRFEAIVNTANATADAYTLARSNIYDTDVAAESANLAKTSIIQQAGISVLAQAKMQPQLLLKLLE
ncbi:MAG: flagellin FliC [Magnetococcales bacterium]|nr:flagellin FliC [Magnetococcales bacterium]NGZ06262.1 flagellin FliC [Magnetococcales bacterium]